jgi:nucleoside-diphosphate-sugar epimerase
LFCLCLFWQEFCLPKAIHIYGACMQRKIIITGGGGYIGQHALRAISEDDVSVYALVRNRPVIRNIRDLKNVKFIIQDIEKRMDLPIEVTDTSHVLHLAWGRLDDYQSPAHLEIFFSSHLKFLKDLISRGIQSITIAGTCFEYGFVSGPISSLKKANPVSAYANAKNQLREELTEIARTYGVRLKWGRIFYVHGKNDTKPSIFRKIDEANSSQNKSVEMTDCNQIRDYLSVEDVAKQLISLSLSTSSGTFNVCSAKPVKLRDIVLKYIEDNSYTVTPAFGCLTKPEIENRDFWGERTQEWRVE